MIHKFKTTTGVDVSFDEKAVIAFKQGKQLQLSYNQGEWKDWSISEYQTMCFGPWFHADVYKWRVKPEEIEVDIEREVTTLVKSTVKIPTPFKGTLDKDQDYFAVKHSTYSTYSKKWWNSICGNHNEQVGEFDVKNFYVYLDMDTAQKAVDILNGNNGESK